MSYKSRPYQKEEIKTIKKLLKEHDHLLVGQATGFGKSVEIYKLVKWSLKKGERVLVIAPRRKLVRQLSETLQDFYPSIIMGSDSNHYKDAEVFIASTPTLHNRLKKHGKEYLGKIDKIIVDEVHYNFGSASMSEVSKLYWDKAKWIGLSATPIDDRGYRLEGWDYTHCKYQSKLLIEQGWLTPIKVMVEDKPRGLDELKLTAGDYNEKDLADFMSDGARVSNVYKVWEKYAQDRKTMIFAVNIQHATLIYEDFIKHGVNAVMVHSNIDEDEEDVALEDFKYGRANVLINVSKLTAGFDEPSVDCILMARPSKSLRLVLQCYGRALRLYEGKTESLILDVAGTISEHGYPTMLRDFNKVRPAPKEKSNVEFAEHQCDNCGYSTQMKNCNRKVTEANHATQTQWFCPNCDAVIKDVVVDHREVQRLIEVKDYTNTAKVSNKDVEEFVKEMATHLGYKFGWVYHIGQDYIKNKEFRELLKIQHNKFKAGMTSYSTVLKHINEFRKDIK